MLRSPSIELANLQSSLRFERILPGGWMRLAAAAWLVLLVVVSIRVLISPHQSTVYPIFARAGELWRSGGEVYLPTDDMYRYSPFVAMLFVPMSMLPMGIGGVLWRLGSAAVILTSFLLCLENLFPRRFSSADRGKMVLLLAVLATGNVNNGQSNLLIIGLLMAAALAMQRAKLTLAAICIALATMFKIYPVVFGGLLIIWGGWKFAWRLFVALFCGAALPFMFQEPAYVWSQYAAWFDLLAADDRTLMDISLWYRDLRLLCHQIGIGVSRGHYLWIEAISGILMAGICVAGRLRRWPDRLWLTTTLWLATCWMTLFGPATESTTYVLLAPALIYSLIDAWSGDRSFWLRLGATGSFVFMLSPQIILWFGSAGRQFSTLGPMPAAAILLLACLLAQILSALLVPVGQTKEMVGLACTSVAGKEWC